MSKKTTKNLADAIRHKLSKDDDRAAAVARERFNLCVGSEICRVRTEAGLTQKALADQIGTHQSVIARLEDAEYDGHSLRMLERVAEATGNRLEVRFVVKNGNTRVKHAPKRRVSKKADR